MTSRISAALAGVLLAALGLFATSPQTKSNPAEAARQALSIVEQGFVLACNGSEVAVSAQTICIHGDTPGAPQIAIAVAQTLRQAGVKLAPLSP